MQKTKQEVIFSIPVEMNEQNMKTILDCISLLNNEITEQNSTPATLEVFMKLMQLEIDNKKEVDC